MFSVLPEVLSRQVLLHTIQNVVYCYKNTFEYQFEAISFAVCHSQYYWNKLFRLPEKYHYAINKPIYCPVKTKKKKLFFQRPSKLKGILLWTTLFFVYAFVALVIENFHM